MGEHSGEEKIKMQGEGRRRQQQQQRELQPRRRAQKSSPSSSSIDATASVELSKKKNAAAASTILHIKKRKGKNRGLLPPRISINEEDSAAAGPTESAGAVVAPRFDRYRSALKFLKNIPLGLEGVGPIAPGDKQNKQILESPNQASRAARFRTIYASAPRTAVERPGWEEKLCDEKIIGAQVGLAMPSFVPYTLFSVLHSRSSMDEVKQSRNRDNLLLLHHKLPGNIIPSGNAVAKRGRRGKRGVSYGHLLKEPPTEYDPTYLCQGFKLKRHRAVMKLPGVTASVISYVKKKVRRRELNEQFRNRHQDWLTAAKFTLSKANKVKKLITEIAVEIDLELATAALAYAYFERLVLRNVVSKYNRKAAAGAALLLAFKYSEPVPPDSALGRGKLSLLFEQIENKLHVKRSEVVRTELGALVHLHFDLQISEYAMLEVFESTIQVAPDPDLELDPAYAQVLNELRRPEKRATAEYHAGAQSKHHQQHNDNTASTRNLKSDHPTNSGAAALTNQKARRSVSISSNRTAAKQPVLRPVFGEEIDAQNDDTKHERASILNDKYDDVDEKVAFVQHAIQRDPSRNDLMSSDQRESSFNNLANLSVMQI